MNVVISGPPQPATPLQRFQFEGTMMTVTSTGYDASIYWYTEDKLIAWKFFENRMGLYFNIAGTP